jgi:hypothetical protein
MNGIQEINRDEDIKNRFKVNIGILKHNLFNTGGMITSSFDYDLVDQRSIVNLNFNNTIKQGILNEFKLFHK